MGREKPAAGVRSASRVMFGVLGPVAVNEGATELDLGGPKQRAALAMLIARSGDPVSSDSLIAATCGDDAAPNAKRRIQVYVSTLRGSDGRLELYDGRGGLTGDMGDDRLAFSVGAAKSSMNPSFSPDASFIATVGRGEAVKVSSIDGALVATIDVEIPDAGAAFHPTESWVYVADGEDVTVYSVDVDELVETAAADVWRSLTEDECQRYLHGSCGEAAVGRR